VGVCVWVFVGLCVGRWVSVCVCVCNRSILYRSVSISASSITLNRNTASYQFVSNAD